MQFPNLKEEKLLWKKGIEVVAGVDEVGRGPLAGPVVAGAVCVNLKFKNHKLFKSVKDSKQLSAAQRNKIYNEILNCSYIEWAIAEVSESIIDKMNILEATKLAMQKALKNLNSKLDGKKIDFVLIDGNIKFKWDYKYKSIVKGDQKVFSISVASIIAKVYRDNLMEKYAKKYPQYGFEIHKGYGTKKHFENLEKFGPCKIHRKTFYPVSKYGCG